MEQKRIVVANKSRENSKTNSPKASKRAMFQIDFFEGNSNSKSNNDSTKRLEEERAAGLIRRNQGIRQTSVKTEKMSFLTGKLRSKDDLRQEIKSILQNNFSVGKKRQEKKNLSNLNAGARQPKRRILDPVIRTADGEDQPTIKEKNEAKSPKQSTSNKANKPDNRVITITQGDGRRRIIRRRSNIDFNNVLKKITKEINDTEKEMVEKEGIVPTQQLGPKELKTKNKTNDMLTHLLDQRDYDIKLRVNQNSNSNLASGDIEDIEASEINHDDYYEQYPMLADAAIKDIERRKKALLEMDTDVAKGVNAIEIMVDFPLPGPDGLIWRTYKFQTEQSSGQIIDLKILIEKDFGYLVKDIALFHNFERIQDDLIYIRDLIDDNQITTLGKLTLIFIPMKNPVSNRNKFLRSSLPDTKVDLKFHTKGEFAKTIKDFLESDHSRKLLLPPVRDWTKEFFDFKRKIVELEKKSKEEIDRLGGGNKVNMKAGTSNKLNIDLQNLFKYAKAIYSTIEEFMMTAKKCIAIIEHWNIEPQEIKYLYGIGGRKFVLGGIVIRECKFIYFHGRRYEEPQQIFRILKHKIAMLNQLRNMQSKIVVPMACLIEYYGTYFVAHAAVAVSFDTLVYGSFTQNLLIRNSLSETDIIEEISKRLNIKKHKVKEIATGKFIEIVLTPGIEIHKVGDILYITDVEYLMPFEILPLTNNNEIRYCGNEEIYFLPLNMVQESKQDIIDEAYKKVSSLVKLKCDECEEYIPDAKYYLYEKTILLQSKDTRSGLNKQLIWENKTTSSSTCCISCYRKLAEHHRLRYDSKKYKLKSFRSNTLGNYYIHKRTGELLDSIPSAKIPLNPDACYFEEPENPDEFEGLKDDRIRINMLLEHYNKKKLDNIIAEIESLDVEIVDGEELSAYLKFCGFPIRRLSAFIDLAQRRVLKELIAREVIARVARDQIQKSISELKEQPRRRTQNTLQQIFKAHFNHLFTGDPDEEAKGLWRVIARVVDEKFKIKFGAELQNEIHIIGLAIRILQLTGAKLNVDIEVIDFTAKYPFMSQFFSIEECRVIRPIDEQEPFNFFNILAEYYQKLGMPSSWWLTSGEENNVAIFFRTQAYQFSRLVISTE